MSPPPLWCVQAAPRCRVGLLERSRHGTAQRLLLPLPDSVEWAILSALVSGEDAVERLTENSMRCVSSCWPSAANISLRAASCSCFLDFASLGTFSAALSRVSTKVEVSISQD